MNVFVRYRRVNDKWEDVDIRQARAVLSNTATVQELLEHLESKWAVNPAELVVRVYDKDFGEFVDIEDEPETVALQNISKYEVIHRIGKWAQFNKPAPIPHPSSHSQQSQKSPSVSTTVSHEDEHSEPPPSIGHSSVFEEDDGQAASSSRDTSASKIDEITTKALSISTSAVINNNNFIHEKPSTAAGPPGSVMAQWSFNVVDQLERSDYGQQCLDHFEELVANPDMYLNNSIKVKLVNIIGQWLMKNCRTVGQPTADERRSFVTYCLAQIPCELNSDIFTNKDGTGTLDNYVKNKRQASKRRDGYILAAKRPRLDSPEGPIDPVMAASPDDAALEAAAKETIVEMATLDPTIFKSRIIEKHKETLKFRRRWIENTFKKDPAGRDRLAPMILTRFPQMTHVNELISIDFDHVVRKKFPNWDGRSLATAWEDIWSKKILHYALNNGNPFAVNALRDYGLEKIPSISEEDRCIFSLRLLPSLLQGKGNKVTGLDADSLIVEIKQDNRSIVSAINTVRQSMKITCPLILQLTSYRSSTGNPEFQSSFFVLINETAIPVEGSFSRALELLVQSFMVFEIGYTPRLHGVYRILEYFYGIQSMRRTTCFIQFVDILEKCPL
uniref:PB1 domain-containing protein n=1 Tax=Panagrellus redivivus TaxID=6233 RepID=A0A7E4UTQ0_PANRE